MGSHNPGRFRREGREAFEPHCDPNDLNPYKGVSFWDKSHTNDWLEGWKEAEKAHVFESEETTEEYTVFATYNDELGQEEVGELTLRTIINCIDMPIELEIDGVTYKPEF